MRAVAVDAACDPDRRWYYRADESSLKLYLYYYYTTTPSLVHGKVEG